MEENQSLDTQTWCTVFKTTCVQVVCFYLDVSPRLANSDPVRSKCVLLSDSIDELCLPRVFEFAGGGGYLNFMSRKPDVLVGLQLKISARLGGPSLTAYCRIATTITSMWPFKNTLVAAKSSKHVHAHLPLHLPYSSRGDQLTAGVSLSGA